MKLKVKAHYEVWMANTKDFLRARESIVTSGEIPPSLGFTMRVNERLLETYKEDKGYIIFQVKTIQDCEITIDEGQVDADLRAVLEERLRKLEATTYLIRNILRSDNVLSYQRPSTLDTNGNPIADKAYPDLAAVMTNDGGFPSVDEDDDDFPF